MPALGLGEDQLPNETSRIMATSLLFGTIKISEASGLGLGSMAGGHGFEGL